MSYARIFIPLVQEAKGYEFKGRPPAGRCIIEERGHTGKLSAWVQDLKPETRYSIYLIFATQHRYAGIHMGALDIDPRGKGEIRRDIDGLDLHGFALGNVTAVAVIAIGTSSSAVVSPLCGYKDRAVSWKHDFFEPAKTKKSEKQKKSEPIQEVLKISEIEPIPIQETPSVTAIEPIPIQETPPITEIEPIPIQETPLVTEIEPIPVQETPPITEIEPISIQETPPLTEIKPISIQEMPPVTEIEPVLVQETTSVTEIEPIPIQETPPLTEIESIPVQDPPPLTEVEPIPVQETPLVTEVESIPVQETPLVTEIEPLPVQETPEAPLTPKHEPITVSETLTIKSQPKPPQATKPPKGKPIPRNNRTENFKVAVEELNTSTINASPVRKKNTEALEVIFSSNPVITPFTKQSRLMRWVRISITDPIPLPNNRPQLLEEFFVASSFALYGYLILGMTTDNGPPQYVIGVPGDYDPDQRGHAKRLGFSQFKSHESERAQRGDKGYWLMFINI